MFARSSSESAESESESESELASDGAWFALGGGATLPFSSGNFAYLNKTNGGQKLIRDP